MTRHEPAVAALLAGAAEWRLLSLLLSRPRQGWHEEVRAVAGEVGDPLLREAATRAEGASEGPYHALLGAGAAASPREAARLGFGDPGRALADLAAQYAAFGFAPRQEEPDDHLAVECDFASYLFLKEAYAVCAGSAADAAVARDARARFLREHAALAGTGFASALPDGAPPYLRCVGDAIAGRLPAVAMPHDVPSSEDPLGDGCALTQLQP
ncbi:MAG TPA: molecular chaperone TorD family protein [Anaeromyxobacteraceae bacterium]|nr:molecular chaperone TorD family protein [Anaeromyxobacteraceae bacterium]